MQKWRRCAAFFVTSEQCVRMKVYKEVKHNINNNKNKKPNSTAIAQLQTSRQIKCASVTVLFLFSFRALVYRFSLAVQRL